MTERCYRSSLNWGLLYDVLVNLKPETNKMMFADVDVSFCDDNQLYRTLKQLIIQQNVDDMKCFEEVFQSVLNDVVQGSVQHGYLPGHVRVDDAEVDRILRSDTDYILCVFIRYFRDDVPR